MTPAELRAARRQLGLTQSGLAEALRMGAQGKRTIRMWEADDNVRGVPGPAQVAVEALLKEQTK
jgi:DNA-binding transcriptional regulator YiaG